MHRLKKMKTGLWFSLLNGFKLDRETIVFDIN